MRALELERAAAGMRSASYELDGVAAEILAALALLDRALGDPALASALGEVADAWRATTGELASSLHAAGLALERGAAAYAATESALSRDGEVVT